MECLSARGTAHDVTSGKGDVGCGSILTRNQGIKIRCPADAIILSGKVERVGVPAWSRANQRHRLRCSQRATDQSPISLESASSPHLANAARMIFGVRGPLSIQAELHGEFLVVVDSPVEANHIAPMYRHVVAFRGTSAYGCGTAESSCRLRLRNAKRSHRGPTVVFFVRDVQGRLE